MTFQSKYSLANIGLALVLFGGIAGYAAVSPPSSTQGQLDPDGDRLINAFEARRGTRPLNPETDQDSDGDGKSDLDDAVGYDPFFTFNAAPEGVYTVIDLGPLPELSKVFEVNNRGTVVTAKHPWNYSNFSVHYVGQMPTTYIAEKFHFLNNNDQVLYQPDASNNLLFHQRNPDSAEVIVRDYEPFATSLFGPKFTVYPDGLHPNIGWIEVVSSSVTLIQLLDNGSLAVSMRASYGIDSDLLPPNYPSDGGTLMTGYSRGDFVGETLISTGITSVSNFGFDFYPESIYFWEQVGVVKLTELRTLTGSFGSAFVFTPNTDYLQEMHKTSATTSRVNSMGRQGDHVILESNAELIDPESSKLKSATWKFNDGTEVIDPVNAADNSDDPVYKFKGFADLPDQPGLWKIWFAPEDGYDAFSISLDGPETGGFLRDGANDSQELKPSKIAENGLSRISSKLWRNGRILTNEEILGKDSDWSAPVISALSNSGNFMAGTAIHKDTQARHAILLLKVELTPNPIPATGVVRAKLNLEFLPDGVELLEDMPDFTIQINGTDVENLRQDEYDSKVFYFTPPVFGSPITADYDLSWSGLLVDGEAHPDLTLEDFAKYTTELEEGIEMFSDAIGVSIEEATSRTKKETEDEGLSAEDAAGYYDTWLFTQVSEAMYLMNLHIDDRNITDDAAGKLDTMETVNSEKSASVVSGDFGFAPDTSGGQVDSLSINVQAIDDTASETDAVNNTAKFSISRWGQFNSPVTVNFTLTGTATNGTDYIAVPLSVTIPAHFNTEIVEIEAIPDGIAEGAETVTLALPVDPLDPTAIPIQASVTIND